MVAICDPHYDWLKQVSPRRCGNCRFIHIRFGSGYCPFVRGDCDNYVTPNRKCRFSDRSFLRLFETFGEMFPEKGELRDKDLCQFVVKKRCTLHNKSCTPRVPDTKYPESFTMTCPDFIGVKYKVDRGRFIRMVDAGNSTGDIIHEER